MGNMNILFLDFVVIHCCHSLLIWYCYYYYGWALTEMLAVILIALDSAIFLAVIGSPAVMLLMLYHHTPA